MEENSLAKGSRELVTSYLSIPHAQMPGRQLEVRPRLSPQGHLHDSCTRAPAGSTRQRQAVMDYCSLWLLFTAQSNLGDTHISQFRDFFYFMKNQPAVQAGVTGLHKHLDSVSLLPPCCLPKFSSLCRCPLSSVEHRGTSTGLGVRSSWVQRHFCHLFSGRFCIRHSPFPTLSFLAHRVMMTPPTLQS